MSYFLFVCTSSIDQDKFLIGLPKKFKQVLHKSHYLAEMNCEIFVMHSLED